MSVLYSILKPIVKKTVKGKAHGSLVTWEEYCKTSYEMQAKFKFKLPKRKGYEFRDEETQGYHVIVGHKQNSNTKKAIMYLVGGGCRRYQMPSNKSLFRYIDETDRDIWIPLYPLSPDYTFVDMVAMLLSTYEKMLKQYKPKDIVWLGFSGGADLIMSLGRHMVHEKLSVPMPGAIIPVSCGNLYLTEDTKAQMREIEKRDIMMEAADLDSFEMYYNHDGTVPRYYLGCAAEDDYTGFPRTILYFGGDEVLSGEAPEYEKALKRCKVDYKIVIGEGMFHAYPFFTFVKEGKEGETAVIKDINSIG